MRIIIIPLTEEAYSNCEDISSSGRIITIEGTLYGTIMEVPDDTAQVFVSIDSSVVDQNTEAWDEPDPADSDADSDEDDGEE